MISTRWETYLRIYGKASLINDIEALSGPAALLDGHEYTILGTTSHDKERKQIFQLSHKFTLYRWNFSRVPRTLESADALARTEVKNSLNLFANTLTFRQYNGHDVSFLGAQSVTIFHKKYCYYYCYGFLMYKFSLSMSVPVHAK